jgi:hypothetical protein
MVRHARAGPSQAASTNASGSRSASGNHRSSSATLRTSVMVKAEVLDAQPLAVTVVWGAGQPDDFHGPAVFSAVTLTHRAIFAQVSACWSGTGERAATWNGTSACRMLDDSSAGSPLGPPLAERKLRRSAGPLSWFQQSPGVFRFSRMEHATSQAGSVDQSCPDYGASSGSSGPGSAVGTLSRYLEAEPGLVSVWPAGGCDEDGPGVCQPHL